MLQRNCGWVGCRERRSGQRVGGRCFRCLSCCVCLPEWGGWAKECVEMREND